jgi:hypothetical protein
VRYIFASDAERQKIKVIGGKHTWYMSENQYDIGYLTEIHKFFTEKCGNVGVAEPVQSTLKLWPNPTSGRFTIATEEAASVEVMDVQGRCVAKFTLELGTHQMDISNLTEGVYFIKEDNGAVKKVMLTK